MKSYIHGGIIELHNYYISLNGSIQGIELYTRDFISIPGPFVEYDANKCMLKTHNMSIYLPKGFADKTESPAIYQRTHKFLHDMSV